MTNLFTPISIPKEIPFAQMLEEHAAPSIRERIWQLMNEEETTHIVLFGDLEIGRGYRVSPRFLAVGPGRTFAEEDFERLIGGEKTHLPWRLGQLPSQFIYPTFYSTKAKEA